MCLKKPQIDFKRKEVASFWCNMAAVQHFNNQSYLAKEKLINGALFSVVIVN